MTIRRRNLARGLAAALVCAWASLAASSSAGFDKVETFSADRLEVRNLIGEIRVLGHAGSRFEVSVRVQGRDATPDRVRIETTAGEQPGLTVAFPLEETHRFVYPALRSGRAQFSSDDAGNGSWISRLLGSALGKQIEVSRDGRGLEIWADVTVKVPAGKRLDLWHGAGAIEARNVDAPLNLNSRVGNMAVSRVTGDASLDTGSGSVEVDGARGRLVIDTGSGRVKVVDVSGSLLVDTGSGDVSIERQEGDRLTVDTGSGSVSIRTAANGSIHVDTGSGEVEARGISADSLSIDTGSGRVTLALSRMGAGSFDIDTGSGGITLELPHDASASLRAETNGGAISLDLGPDARVEQRDRREATARIGAGGAKIVLDTGSGPIRVSQAR